MGSNIPNSRRQRLEWIEGLIDQWEANQSALGVSAEQLAQLSQLIADARSGLTNANELRLNAKAATSAFHARADAAHTLAGNLVKVIKGHADVSANPASVYLAAGLTPRKAPGPSAAPDAPSINGAGLGGDGSITIDFAGTGPVGTVWQVSRRLAHERAFSVVGFADPATKSFTDEHLPAGTSSATYQVRGVRGKLTGPPSVEMTVRLGGPSATRTEDAQKGVGLAA